MSVSQAITVCRVCGNPHLVPILDLGAQALTGIFPKSKNDCVPSVTLQLVQCCGPTAECCGLIQLSESTDPNLLYTPQYGYRSSLNQSMIDHLSQIRLKAESYVQLRADDIIVDIASNDNTLLKQFRGKGIVRCGIDPLGGILSGDADITQIESFFSAHVFRDAYPHAKAKIVTSIAMLYDIESPLDFFADVYAILDNDGVWVTEQSYMPHLIRAGVYDVVCHEHLEYYGMRQLVWMAERSGFKIIDVELNQVNGGSLQVVFAKKGSRYPSADRDVTAIVAEEKSGLYQSAVESYRVAVRNNRDRLCSFLEEEKGRGRSVCGYGASTKGNVVLQYCGIDATILDGVLEINPSKFGAFTPGTCIPIVEDTATNRHGVDSFLVLPWHFRNMIEEREKDFCMTGGRLMYPFACGALV